MKAGKGRELPALMLCPRKERLAPMNQNALQAYFRLGMLITVGSVLLLMVQQPDTAEYVVTVLSVCIGVVLMALVALAARFL